MSDKHYDDAFHAAVRANMQATSTPVALGWEILRKARVVSGAHLTEKELFMAGAGYIFDAMAHYLSSDSEPTADDIEFLEKIHSELKLFHAHFNSKLNK